MNFTPKRLFFACLLLICESAVCTDKTLINFQEMDLDEASEAGKKIMVSFAANWCLPGKAIKTSLYNNPEIADFVNNNFQAVMVDVDSSLGELWNQNYNVHYLPSVFERAINRDQELSGVPKYHILKA